MGNGIDCVLHFSTLLTFTGSSIVSMLGVVLLSVMAFPLLYFLQHRKEMENGLMVFGAGVFFCFVLVTLATRVFANKNCNYFYYVFSVFAFTAMVDLDIAFTLDDVVMPWVNFYLKVRLQTSCLNIPGGRALPLLLLRQCH